MEQFRRETANIDKPKKTVEPQTSPEEPQTRRDLFKNIAGLFGQHKWQAAELASTVPALGLGISGALHQDSYAQTTPTLPYQESTLFPFYDFVNEMSVLSANVDALYQEYRREYYRSHTETRTVTNSDGTTSTETETVWEWEEPSYVPDHSVIESWQETARKLTKIAEKTAERPEHNMRSSESLEIKLEQPNTTAKLTFLGIVYGITAGGLLQYEEILDKLEVIRDKKYKFERRNFVKLIAAGIAAIPAFAYHDKHVEHTEESASRVQEQVKTIVVQGNGMSGDALLQELFYTNRHQLYAALDVMQKETNKTLTHQDSFFKTMDRKVRNAFGNLQTVLPVTKESLYQRLALKSPSIPLDVEQRLRQHYIEREISNLNSRESRAVYTYPLLEAGIMAGILAVICGGNEVLQQKGV